MRRFALVISLVGLSLAPAVARADYVGAPITHGPDSRFISEGDVMPPPAGGPTGRLAKRGAMVHAAAVNSLLPSRWCGTETSVDDTAHALQNGTYRYHAVYMIPADGADHFASYATTMQSAAFEASGLLERLYNRAIRFDLGTSCGSQYLDISVVRMPQTTAQLESLANSSSGTFDTVSKDLDDAGFPTIQPSETTDQAATLQFNYVVWLDGPAPAGSCGQATIYDDPSRADDNLNNLGGKVAVVYRDSGGGFCSSNAVRHEIGHNLGALQRVAPHAFDGMHCNDAAEDTMCYPNVSPQVANGQEGLFFDYHNDDYWDPPAGPPLPWWTVNLNRFLCPDASCNVVPGAVQQAPTPSCPARDALREAKSGAVACAASNARVRLRARRVRHGWKLSARVKGSGRAVIAVRCRRRAGGQVRTVLTRRATLPRRFRARVGCRSRPTVEVFPL